MCQPTVPDSEEYGTILHEYFPQMAFGFEKGHEVKGAEEASEAVRSARSVFSRSGPIIGVPVRLFLFDMAKTKVFEF